MNYFFYTLIALGFITFNATSYASEAESLALDSIIHLPNEETLSQRIIAVSSPHFLEKTNLHKKLTSSPKNVLGVNLAAQLAFYDYKAMLNDNRVMQNAFSMTESLIIKAILKDCPQAITLLQQNRLLAE